MYNNCILIVYHSDYGKNTRLRGTNLKQFTYKFRNCFKNYFKNASHSKLIITGFAGFILFGTVLLIMPFANTTSHTSGFMKAFFTSASAVCLCGLTVAETSQYWTLYGQIVILALIQIGGLGVMSISTLLFLSLGKKIPLKKKKALTEALDLSSKQNTLRYIRYVLLLTFIIETVGAILLCGVFIPVYGVQKGIYMSIFHSVAYFCNSGFILLAKPQLMMYATNLLFNLITCILTILGGLGFAVIIDIVNKKRFYKFSLNTKIVLISSASLIVAGAVIILISEFSNPVTLGDMNMISKTIAGFSNSILIRSSGNLTFDIFAANSPALIIAAALMFIGSAPGSMGGGLRTTPIAVLLLTAWNAARGDKKTSAMGRSISERNIRDSICAISFAFVCFLLSAVLLAFSENAPLSSVVFEAASAVNLSGLTAGLTPSLSVFGQIVIIVTMFTARVGFMSVAYFFALKYNDENKYNYDYPTEDLII